MMREGSRLFFILKFIDHTRSSIFGMSHAGLCCHRVFPKNARNPSSLPVWLHKYSGVMTALEQLACDGMSNVTLYKCCSHSIAG